MCVLLLPRDRRDANGGLDSLETRSVFVSNAPVETEVESEVVSTVLLVAPAVGVDAVVVADDSAAGAVTPFAIVVAVDA